MPYIAILISILEILIVIVPVLLTVAFVTVAERKTMASMQRRLGPNIVGYYGTLQAFADALKLLLKEYISPTQSNLVLFFLGPIITLVFSLLGFCVIPYGPGLAISDFNLGILYMLAVSSLSTYGILLAGWSANSKYAFLGSLRSTAQLISYELILSSAILLVILLSGSLSLTVNVELQNEIWYIFPLLPVFIIFFIGSIAETNRAPFDLAEAESELVSGFMTEHAAVIFVFFFLAEYASIVLICILISILFLGGYFLSFPDLSSLVESIYYVTDIVLSELYNMFYDVFYYINNHVIVAQHPANIDYLNAHDAKIKSWLDLVQVIDNGSLNEYYLDWTRELEAQITLHKRNSNWYTHIYYVDNYDSDIHYSPLLEGLVYGLTLGLKSCVMIFIFIWARASFPRIRYDQLMSFCWTILLPLVVGFIILFPCVLNAFSILPTNIAIV